MPQNRQGALRQSIRTRAANTPGSSWRDAMARTSRIHRVIEIPSALSKEGSLDSKDIVRQPSPGDVLVTTEAGVHFLSVVPYPHRVSFKELDRATEIAAQWAKANGAVIWRKVDGEIFKLK